MRKIILYTESLRIAKPIAQQPEQFSYDGRAIIGLLKNNIEALRSGSVDIEPVGFEGKDQFMKELPLAISMHESLAGSKLCSLYKLSKHGF